MSGLESKPMKKPLRERSALVYVLVALIPYSRPNLLLTFKPGLFFRDLEKISRYKQATLRAAYQRAQQQGLIKQQDNLVALTIEGRRKVLPFVAERLSGEAQLMVIFDIPEDEAKKRRQLRKVLKDWQFKQVQKSVWLTNKDYRAELVEVIKELRLDGFVELYECARQFPK